MTRSKIAVMILGLGAALASAADAQTPPKHIVEADWLVTPNSEDFARAYPQIAMRLNLAGRVSIHCKVDVSGRVEDCGITEETPQGVGFGKAALTLSKGFLLRPQTIDGVPVAGGEINVPLVFALPSGPAPVGPPPPQPRSPEALALAEKTLAAAKTTEAAAQTYARTVAAFELDAWPDLSPENAAAIANALRASYPMRLKEITDEQAQLYASLFTDAELTQLEAFFKTPAAAILFEGSEVARANGAALAGERRRRQIAISQQILCATHACEPDTPAAAPEAPPWLHVPSAAQVWQVRPEIAQPFSLPGSAELTCAVIAQGGLSQCRVTAESPTGLGFGGAALSLAGFYSLDVTAPKASAVGQTVTFRVHFGAGEASEASQYQQVAARSPQSLAMARELLVAMNPESTSPTAPQRKVAAEQPPARGVTRADQTAVFDVMDETYRRLRVEMMDLRAAWLTTQLTDADLAEALKTWRGPVGSTWRTHSAELTTAAQRAGRQTNVRVWSDVSKAFCVERPCYTPKPPAPKPAQPAIAVSSAPSTAKP